MTMERRCRVSRMRTNASAKANPSVLARKSDTYDGIGACFGEVLNLLGIWRGASFA
jgi:hypothetical protein